MKYVTAVVTVILINLSVQRDIVGSVVASHCAIYPYRGPVERERGGGPVRRRQSKRPIVAVAKLPCKAVMNRWKNKRGEHLRLVKGV